MEIDTNKSMPSINGLYIRVLGPILFSFFAVALLNYVTPLGFVNELRIFVKSKGGWILPATLPFLLLGSGLLQYGIQKPLLRAIKDLKTNNKIPSSQLDSARRRLLNLPFLTSGLILVMWIGIPVIMALSLALFYGVPAKTSIFLLFRGIMVGMIASAVSFFLLENYSRKTLIPFFFPNGRLAAVTGTIRISIKRRIRALYIAGTSVPMIILLGTLVFVLWEMEEATLSAKVFGKEILIFCVVLAIIFFIVALRLNGLVTRSILNPIGDMLKVVAEVRKGDFTRKVSVISNDELGILGDAGNDMIAGLQDRERIRDIFGKYVTPEIRDRILSGGIPLSGERIKATVLFSDLRDFTSYTERNDPEEVIQSMRAYFTAMQRAIREHQGLVLQYVGDEVEAVFGVPFPCEGHANQAVLAALEMRKSLEEFNREREREGKSIFRHGIGIHTGEVLAGNTGSEDRPSYALVGDTVNLASRIRDLTKKFKWDILASEETVKQLKSSFEAQKCKPQKVRGYSKTITVFRIIV